MISTALPAAILWDLDGTLVDTEPLWMAAETELVLAHGGVWTHEDALSLVGSSLDNSAEVFRSRGVDLSAQGIIDQLIATVNDQVRANGPAWRPGALELLAQAKAAGVPQAIVTMSYRMQAQTVVDVLPPGTIATIVGGDMVSQGKPHPEAYLRAAADLGVDVRDCLAVEDSRTGVAAALRSGAATIAVPYLVDVPAQPGLAHVVSLEGADLATITALARGVQLPARPGATTGTDATS